MKKYIKFIFILSIFVVSVHAQTNGEWTYTTSDRPYITYSFVEDSSWSLTWTYYYINWYRVNGVKIYYFPGINTNISDIGLSYNYGIWHGYWNWDCKKCDARGTTPCNTNPCAGTLTTVYPDRNLDWDYYILYNILDSSSPSLINPTYVDENTNQRYYNSFANYR